MGRIWAAFIVLIELYAYPSYPFDASPHDVVKYWGAA